MLAVAVAAAAISVVYVELRRPRDREVLPSEAEKSLASSPSDRSPIELPTDVAVGESDPAALPVVLGGAEPPFDLDRTRAMRRAGDSSIWRFGPVPPGMVFVPGGETVIGTPRDELNELLEKHPTLQKNAAGFLAEVPQHTVHVDGFYLMTTEVTNEQYLAYVEATEARPPHHWSRDAIDEARRQHLQAEEAREGTSPGPFEGGEFRESSWWTENWQDVGYEMPEDLAGVPAVFVSHDEARAYAEWAGLRLPTEEEFERAVRGNTDRTYPWSGPFVIGKHAATKEGHEAGDLFAVGSFPGGATDHGALDLAGNAWEWTDSRYLPYPGWERSDLGPSPSWNRNFRVVKGGSKQNSYLYSRCTTRGGFAHPQQASALGFRCALSVKPGLDLARRRCEELLTWTTGADFDDPPRFHWDQVSIRHRWRFARGTADVPNYEIITGYDHILFVPARDARIEGHPLLGCLSTSLDVLEPELPAGQYLLAAPGYSAHLPVDLNFDRIHVFDWRGDWVASLSTGEPSWGDDVEDATEWMQLRTTVRGAEGTVRVVRVYLGF